MNHPKNKGGNHDEKAACPCSCPDDEPFLRLCRGRDARFYAHGLQCAGRLLLSDGNTWPLAEYAAAYLNADLFRIEPAIPYTDADLNYNDADCRANQEMNDETSRPTLAATVENMAQYDTVVLAFPIWWGQAPRLIETFVEAHDLSGKTVLTFCTSASSGYGRTGEILAALTDGTVNWIEGARFSASTTAEEMEAWLAEKGIAPYTAE